ncbi:sensor histidine kinase [Niallia circulans]|uniref:Signal transduction histidine-protein kinase ArlS n=1 Tax=Niallia circulans TaxID=1397 RepID=A0A553SN04_NIACI|nr:HAMP domain-containing histidine kinase [Niallia circulans]TRZ38352.1 sensor histidine kinase [Niallia circulans]
MKVRTRIQVFSTLLLVIMMICLNTTIYFVFQKEILRNETNETAAKLTQTAQNIQTATTETNQNALLRAFVPTEGMIRVIDASNTVLFTSTKDSSYAELEHFYSEVQNEEVLKHDGITFSVTSMPVVWNNGNIVKLEMSENIDGSVGILQILQLILFIGTILIIVPTFLAGRVLSSFILTPIQSLIRTMEDIQANGSFQKLPLKEKSKDELYQLGSTFNKMISRLEIQYDKQKQFVYDASHELRTPLTVIESYANMLKRWGKNKPDALEEGIDAILSEAVRMKEMTNDMLDLAKADDLLELQMEEMNLWELCSQTAKNMEMATGRKVEVDASSKEVIVTADKQKMKQLLLIFIDNAFKYGADHVTIRAYIKDKTVFLQVADNGFGIAEDHKEHIFDRFFRADKARNREAGGAGLGLAIARQIVDAHSGEIEVESVLGEGSTFTCSFPADIKAVSK